MRSLVHKVGRAIRQDRLLEDGDRVVAAVSGGPDSMALVHALAHLARAAGWSLAGVVHVNHQLRPEAAADEAFTMSQAASLGLVCDVSRVDVRSLVADSGRSVEAVAREARYQCFEAAVGRFGDVKIATGHTLDDQAETVMLRLLRGAGSRGLSGIRRRRGWFKVPGRVQG